MNKIEKKIKIYLHSRPALLAPLRAKEAFLIQQYLPFKKPVLDIGCGDGFFAAVVTEVGLRESIKSKKNQIDIGMDVKRSRIDQAEKRGVYEKTVIYDGMHMPFEKNSFATVISNSTLEHISNLDTVLKETYRILKPEGRFLTTVISKPWADHYFWSKLAGNWYKRWMNDKQEHINLFTHKQWDKAFQKSGFKITKKTGHAQPLISTWTDILHYLGIPNLISYKLTGKWVLFPVLAEKFFPAKYFTQIASKNSSIDKSVALFYELRK